MSLMLSLSLSIDFVLIPFLLILFKPLDSIVTASVLTKSIAIIREIFLKYWLYNLPERLLYHPVKTSFAKCVTPTNQSAASCHRMLG
jgi:hypothetical protein